MPKSPPAMIPTLTKNYARLSHPFAIGFDPSVLDLHPFLKGQYETLSTSLFLKAWYRSVVEPIASASGAIKFQSAFFEAAGIEGLKALTDMIEDAKERGLYVILDAKRGDIKTTMEAYGAAAYDGLKADALTILPWMGLDVISALAPWMKRGHGVYTVWLSSNDSGRIVQTQKDEAGKTLAEKLYTLWEAWARHEHLLDQSGFVLGATDIPDWTERILSSRPQSLLMPGIGAQGGKITRRLKALVKNHPATLLPISRGILSLAPGDPVHSWQDYSDHVTRRWRHFINEWQSIN